MRSIPCLFCLALAARADDKRRYHLLDPTPRSLMRPLSADRPDVTESPYTVDAGRFQIEASVLEWTRDDGDVFSILPVNLKAGLFPDVDAQLVFAPLVFDGHGDDAGSFDDATLRVKFNVWGNDEGDTAFAVMPFLTVPTDVDSDEVTGGMIFPFAAALPGDWGLGLMAEVDYLGNSEYQLVTTASVGHTISGDLAGFLEFANAAGEGPWAASLNAGVTYGVSEDLQLDAGVRIGLTDAADDFSFFAGFTLRF
ncbi:MAG: transporter [Planctomycetota bacterium]